MWEIGLLVSSWINWWVTLIMGREFERLFSSLHLHDFKSFHHYPRFTSIKKLLPMCSSFQSYILVDSYYFHLNFSRNWIATIHFFILILCEKSIVVVEALWYIDCYFLRCEDSVCLENQIILQNDQICGQYFHLNGVLDQIFGWKLFQLTKILSIG